MTVRSVTQDFLFSLRKRKELKQKLISYPRNKRNRTITISNQLNTVTLLVTNLHNVNENTSSIVQCNINNNLYNKRKTHLFSQ